MEMKSSKILESLTWRYACKKFDQNKTIELFQEHFGFIQPNKIGSKIIKPVYLSGTVEKKLDQTTQASISLGGPAISPLDKDYPSHSFIIKLLGGYFGSRLMKSLREDKGWTYGVHAYMLQLRQGNFLQIAADVKLEAVDESIALVKEEIQRLLEQPVSQDEIDTVKNYMLGEYVNDSKTAFDFAGLYKKILIQDLPSDYFDNFYGQIAELNTDRIETIKHQVVDLSAFSIVKIY